MKYIIQELTEQKNIRTNLSNLRKMIKDGEAKKECLKLLEGKEDLILSFLEHEDAKSRKNAALLLGDLEYQKALDALYKAYQNETTLFVKASYLQAVSNLDCGELLDELRADLEKLLAVEKTEENKKHLGDEIRMLRKIMIDYDGIDTHTIDIKGKNVSVLLTANKNHREVVRQMTGISGAKVHPLGVMAETDNLLSLMQLRTFREVLFPIHTKGLLSKNPSEAAKAIWESDMMGILENLHKGEGSFYFRVECKSPMTLEERSSFTKKFGSCLETISDGKLINSTGDYEVELRLIANKDGEFFPCLKLMTLKDRRFTYRKNTIAASIHPSTAALIMELAAEYLKKNAQIMDPFCGVGTMLIERDIKVPAKEIYATEIFGDAVVFGRENARLAGERIHFIHRDFFDFKHEYLFDEIITNMPLRGRKTKQEMDEFYAKFFVKAKEILKKEATLILYTNEIGFVKKQLRLHKEYHLLKEYCMQTKGDFYLMVIGYREK
uniref:methyltransferase n=1 Tax=Agathobacter sp. TaxID=2021311 RepID=UPI004056B8CB